MRLYIVQHALAHMKGEDPERSLTDTGIADIKKVTAFTAENRMIDYIRIFHSGKKRACQTAEILAEYLTPGTEPSEIDGLNPKDDPEYWYKRLLSETEDIMLVATNRI